MSFIAELKQRKVFRVAMVYLVVAWVAIQAASIAMPAFDAPPWALRVVILLFALGFPLALLLTWVLDLTPEGIQVATGKVGNKRMAGIAAGLIALALGWYFLGQPALRQQAIAGERSIAVLPFVNMSGDKANEYFSDGLAETTLDMLAQVKDLKVIARTSSFAFKGKNDDVRTIGKALDAAHLLEGSVQQAGDTVRITVQLIRTSDGVHLWSQRYDRKLADIFRIQDEIATEVVRALQLALPSAEQKQLLRKRTDNVGAYDEYLKGIALLPGRKVPEMRQALTHFEKAIKLDPTYARAHAMAGSTLGLIDVYADISDQDRLRVARYIDRALELAPDLGEAYAARGAELQRVGDLEGAERAFRRAVELAPGYATGYQWLGEFLLDMLGEVEEALPNFERALALDPLSPIVHKEYVDTLAAMGRLDDAERELGRLLRNHPGFSAAYHSQARLRALRGDLTGALRALDEGVRRDPEIKYARLERCQLLVRFGALASARECTQAHLRNHPDDHFANGLQVNLLLYDGKLQEAHARNAALKQPDPYLAAYLAFELQRRDEAEAAFRKLSPDVFKNPPDTSGSYVEDQLLIGRLLADKGDATGQALIEDGVRRAAARAPGAAQFSRRWWDAWGLALLGQLDEACAALRTSVAAGQFTSLAELDISPTLAPLRAKSCYAEALAPARARAAMEVDKARAAGLL